MYSFTIFFIPPSSNMFSMLLFFVAPQNQLLEAAAPLQRLVGVACLLKKYWVLKKILL